MMKTAFLCLFFASALVASAQSQNEFVTVSGKEFLRNGKPYRYVGANYWYGALLGSTKYGDRERLKRELDEMKQNGIENLRVLSGAEGGAYDYTVPYALQPQQGVYDQDILDGLDYLLAEMAKRNMVAVIYLGNNWEWSGGFAQYLEWNGYGSVPNPNLKGNTWPQFMEYTSRFYQCEPCKEAYYDHIKTLLSRTNAYTGKKYTQDPTIMSWQLANEPRIFNQANEKAFTDWVNASVTLIKKTLAARQLVCTGSEGAAGSNDDILAFERTHANPGIDYLTMHIWPKNWGWFDHHKESETLPVAKAKAMAYIEAHLEVASRLNRPIVAEEFGLPRRGENLSGGENSRSRNAFYEMFFKQLVSAKEQNDVFAGVNFWGYGGEGKAVTQDGKWNKGDSFTADPPQEPQGLNSVFSSDTQTLKLIRKYNRKLAD